MASASPSKESLNGGGPVPLIKDDITFEELQRRKMTEMEAKMKEDIKRKRHEWERRVDKMRDEFLLLLPVTANDDKQRWSSDESLSDPFVRKRRGSTDVLDRRKMKTLFMDYPESGRKFKIRFDVSEFDPHTIRINTDGERIIVRARKKENGKDIEYMRKIEKPREVNMQKLKSFLTSDMILIVEAPLPPHKLKLSNSPSHSSSHGSGSHTSIASSRSRSNSNSPSTPSAAAKPKYNMPTFHGEEGERFLSLIIDIGNEFTSREITVQVINDQCIQVKAKHEIRTSDRLKKCKFFKEYELQEKIETYSLRAGLTNSYKLVIGALGKGHSQYSSKSEVGDAVANEIQSTCSRESLDIQSCNVLDLASFPPTAAPPLPKKDET